MAVTGTTLVKTLKDVDYEGIIHEDVMDELFNIDPIDLPYQDMAGKGEAAKDFYKSWVKEHLKAPDLNNAHIDGDVAPDAGTFNEERIGNHIQLSIERVKVSTGARLVDTIGYSDRLAHEITTRQKELKRSMEAILVSNQGSVAMTDAVAGKTAGCGAMFETNIINGTAGGFANGIYTAPTPGAAAALTEDAVRDAAEMAYTKGGNIRILMSVPKVIRKFSEYALSAAARMATLMTDASPQQARVDGKYGKKGVTAVGAVNTFISDFDTLEFTPNRMQQLYDNGGTDCANVYLFDPEYWDVSYLRGITTEELAKEGTSDSRMMNVYYLNMALQEKSSAVIMGVDPTQTVTAS